MFNQRHAQIIRKQWHAHKPVIHEHHPVLAFFVVITEAPHPRHHHGYRYKRKRFYTIKFYQLHPRQDIKIMTDVTVGHTVVDTVVYLDQHGNPMLVAPKPDSAPVWAKLAADTVDTMSVSADGSTDTIEAVGAGVDTVTVTVIVGGVTFTASQQLTISPEAQVLTSIAIDGEVE